MKPDYDATNEFCTIIRSIIMLLKLTLLIMYILDLLTLIDDVWNKFISPPNNAIQAFVPDKRPTVVGCKK